MKITKAIICLSLFLLSTIANAKVYDYHLKNGLRLLVKVDHRAPVAVFEVWYKVGSSYESTGTTGIAHLTEHMMFDGTPTYPEGVLTKTLAENGAMFNAFTDRDFTAYYEEMAAKKLPLAFKLESDRMINLSLTQQQFNKEIQVVKEERRLRTDDQPSQIALERFMAAAYISSPYHHPVVGWMDDLDHMSVGKVRRWYHDWYAPNNATIVIVGDVNPERMLLLTTKYFGYLNKQKLPPVPATAEVPSLGERQVTVHIPAEVPLLLMGYNVPSLKTATDTWQVYALDVLTGILSGDQSSRFARDLIRGDEIASQADASYDPFSRLSSLFILSGTPAQKDSLKQLQEAFSEQIKKIQQEPVTNEELQRVKAEVIADKVFSRDSIVNQANELGAMSSVDLPITTVDDYSKHIQAVTAKQIQLVAKQYLIPSNLTVTWLTPKPMSEQDKQRIRAGISTGSQIH